MRRAAIAIALLLAALPARAAPTFELLAGTAWDAPTRLIVRQDGFAPLSFLAHYRARPFVTPFYYALRAGSRAAAPRWELQLVHHKLYLGRRPAEIQSLQITHGFNLLTVQRAFPLGRATARLGAGVTIPHAEGEVRHRAVRGGYRIAGPAALAGIGARRALGARAWLTGEVQAIAGWADLPVTHGRLRARSVALHLLAGFGLAP